MHGCGVPLPPAGHIVPDPCMDSDLTLPSLSTRVGKRCLFSRTSTVRPAWLVMCGLAKSATAHSKAHAGQGSFGQTAQATYGRTQRVSTTDITTHDSILPRLAAGEP